MQNLKLKSSGLQECWAEEGIGFKQGILDKAEKILKKEIIELVVLPETRSIRTKKGCSIVNSKHSTPPPPQINSPDQIPNANSLLPETIHLPIDPALKKNCTERLLPI